MRERTELERSRSKRHLINRIDLCVTRRVGNLVTAYGIFTVNEDLNLSLCFDSDFERNMSYIANLVLWIAQQTWHRMWERKALFSDLFFVGQNCAAQCLLIVKESKMKINRRKYHLRLVNGEDRKSNTSEERKSRIRSLLRLSNSRWP